MNSRDKEEHIARLLKKCWIYEGRISPTAFSLRPGISETYVSVLRESHPSFKADALKIVKGKHGSFYATLSADELERKKDTTEKEKVTYEVRNVDNHTYKSHAGIYIAINGHHIIGGEPFGQFTKEKEVSEGRILIDIGKTLARMAEKNIKVLS
ncbi:MAG: hypothetical protein IJT53_07825 [Prevotella sp.]|nr:hypothetical protein [Prevotella sp.]